MYGVAKSNEWSTKQLTPGRRAWVRLLQALGKTSGERCGAEAERCRDKGVEHISRCSSSGTAQRAERLSEKSAEVIKLVAEKERIKQQLREAMIPPCPEKVRHIVTQSFRLIGPEEAKNNG
jgi:hypothetical protein